LCFCFHSLLSEMVRYKWYPFVFEVRYQVIRKQDLLTLSENYVGFSDFVSFYF